MITEIKIIKDSSGEEEHLVTACTGGSWIACTVCRYFNNCIFKGQHRTGMLPKFMDSLRNKWNNIKKYRYKFFMNLKHKNNEKFRTQ